MSDFNLIKQACAVLYRAPYRKVRVDLRNACTQLLLRGNFPHFWTPSVGPDPSFHLAFLIKFLCRKLYIKILGHFCLSDVSLEIGCFLRFSICCVKFWLFYRVLRKIPKIFWLFSSVLVRTWDAIPPFWKQYPGRLSDSCLDQKMWTRCAQNIVTDMT